MTAPVRARNRPSDRRQQVLDAALELFGATGSRGTSIAAIAERAGLTDAGVLYHFKTKQALLIAVLREIDRRTERELLSSTHTGIEMLRAVRGWGARMEANPEVQSLHVVLSAEQLHGTGEARAYFSTRLRALTDRYAAAFEDAARRGDLRPDLDPRAEASALIAHLDGIRLQWFLLDGEVSMATSVEAYVDHVLERLAP